MSATKTSPHDPSSNSTAVCREDLDTLSAKLERAPASKIVEWAVSEYGASLALAASFEDVVLIDLAVRIAPEIEVVFCDTRAHFPETISYMQEMSRRFGLHLTITEPVREAEAWPCGTERCCTYRKVEPLRRALSGKQAWMTSLKRVDAPTRAAAPVVGWDSVFGLVKVNPLATWTDADLDSYRTEHRLPEHPLVEHGYLSIGCAPTTRPVQGSEGRRAGRWAGTVKTECGLHVS